MRVDGPQTVGREAERARIEQLLDSATEGPVGLALEGVPGIGKTTLSRDALNSARRRGYRPDFSCAAAYVRTSLPVPIFGWGTIPDQYGRLRDDDQT